MGGWPRSSRSSRATSRRRRRGDRRSCGATSGTCASCSATRVDLGTPSALTLDIANFRDAADVCAYYKAHFGPVIAAYANVADDPERVEALDRDLLDWAERMNRDQPAGRAVFRFEYLLVVARRR